MSKYTTGEIAKLCGVSVRTVQYYDERRLLIPSELSEGGRRLYSEDDLRRMRIICFLREIDIPINSIINLFSEEHPEKAVSLLLEQQEQILQQEIDECQAKLETLEGIRKGVRELDRFSVESIGDIAHITIYVKILLEFYTLFSYCTLSLCLSWLRLSFLYV